MLKSLIITNDNQHGLQERIDYYLKQIHDNENMKFVSLSYAMNEKKFSIVIIYEEI